MIVGWWIWQIFLARAYDPTNRWPYDVRDGFTKNFGKDPTWWLALVLTLTILGVCDLCWAAWSIVRAPGSASRSWPLSWFLSISGLGSFRSDESNVSLWQEIEHDPVVMEKIRQLARDDIQ